MNIFMLPLMIVMMRKGWIKVNRMMSGMTILRSHLEVGYRMLGGVIMPYISRHILMKKLEVLAYRMPILIGVTIQLLMAVLIF